MATEDEKDLVMELAEVVGRRDQAQRSLDAARKAYKRCKQMRGADAHKRGWYFEEQIEKWTGVVSRLDAAIESLQARIPADG
jgi:exonuclease VII small subunit